MFYRSSAVTLDTLTTGTALAPKYFESFCDNQGGVVLHGRYFTYATDSGTVCGATLSVRFSIDRPVKSVWPYFKDFNSWQNCEHYYYSGVVGDLDGKTFRISDKPNDGGPHQYHVIRVIPECLIVLSQSIPDVGVGETGLPGLGEVSPGFMVFSLDECEGQTQAVIFMEHASYASRSKNIDIDQALAPWREIIMDARKKFRDSFVPTLKKIIYENT